MRRGISVLLCVLLWFASGQTTLALHFCGGDLHSVTIATGSGKACCGGEESEERPCCTEEYVETGTDSFYPDPATQNVIGDNEVLPPVALLAGEYEFSVRKISSHLYSYSPPDEAKLSGVEWLIYICIFRI
ncbi:MAG: hypothetical protein LBU03_05715 [Tannerellaceae bacterium]|jgi:hypothetical protein|nr:hypothetical protein [Tannerellaceae bacterium]